MLVVALGFMAGAVYELRAAWDGAMVRVEPGWATLCVTPLLVGSLCQAQAWVLLIEHLTQRRVPAGAALSLYLESQLARYTPGKLGLLLVRMAGAGRLGVAARSVAGSVLLEMLCWVATGALLATGLLALSDVPQDGLLRLVHAGSVGAVGAAGLGLIALVWFDRRHLPQRVAIFLKLSGRGPLVPWTTPVAQLGYWLMWAAHGYFVVRGVSGTGPAALDNMGYFVLAPVLGFVALVAPAGVGVREAVLSLGLAPYVGVAPALAAGVVSRVASLAADLCAWGFCRLLGRSRGWT
jgi:hypothetical protein